MFFFMFSCGASKGDDRKRSQQANHKQGTKRRETSKGNCGGSRDRRFGNKESVLITIERECADLEINANTSMESRV